MLGSAYAGSAMTLLFESTLEELERAWQVRAALAEEAAGSHKTPSIHEIKDKGRN